MYDIFLTVRRHSVILEICLKRIPFFTIILFYSVQAASQTFRQ